MSSSSQVGSQVGTDWGWKTSLVFTDRISITPHHHQWIFGAACLTWDTLPGWGWGWGHELQIIITSSRPGAGIIAGCRTATGRLLTLYKAAASQRARKWRDICHDLGQRHWKI